VANGTASAASGPPEEGGNAPAATGNSPQPAPTQAGEDAAAIVFQNDGTGSADPTHGTTRAADLAATLASDTPASSSAASGTGAAKVSADGLPNFGFSAATATTSSTMAAAANSSTASTTAVPISGLAVAIAARAQAGSNEFEIRLDPPELGRIDVHLNVDSNGQVTSHVTVERADTLQLLQSEQPQIERALEQAGLKTTDNGLQFTLRDQSFAGQNSGQNTGGEPRTAQLVVPDADLSPVEATQAYSRFGLGGGVDIRV